MVTKRSREDSVTEKKSAQSAPALAPHPLLAEAHKPILVPLLNRWLEQKRTPPVLLLTGVAGSGVRDAALFLALSLLCERRHENQGLACLTCGSCLRHQKGQWIDLTEVAPDIQTDSDGTATGRTQSLKIDQFRDVIASQGFGALQGDHKIILISSAERMTPQAANSLLKILEEPPRGWVFFLAASDESLVLPTLRSRCQKLRLRPLPNATVEAILRDEGIAEDRIHACVQRAQGSIDFARKLAQDEFFDRWNDLQAFFKTPTRHLNELVDWAAKEPGNLDFLLSGIEIRLSEMLATGTAPGNPDSKRISFLETYADLVSETRRRSMAPLNRKLLIQNVLMPWLQN